MGTEADTYRPAFEPGPKEADLALIGRGIDENNIIVTGQSTGNKELTFFIRNEKREIIGGIQGTYNNSGWLHINGIWVSEEYRGNGYGTQLMKCIESEAKKHGCTKCHLNTIEHQAPDFYK